MPCPKDPPMFSTTTVLVPDERLAWRQYASAAILGLLAGPVDPDVYTGDGDPSLADTAAHWADELLKYEQARFGK